jgi:hypothetical protein
VRAERLLAKLVWDEYEKAYEASISSSGAAKEDRAAQWRRLRALLADVSLKGCAEGGSVQAAVAHIVYSMCFTSTVLSLCTVWLFPAILIFRRDALDVAAW